MNSPYPVVRVDMASGAHFSFELWTDVAPIACESLCRLIQVGAYNGMSIDRIVPGFVIQPRYQDVGRPDLDFMIPGEFSGHFDIGVIGMAGDGDQLASGSQFFITLGRCDRLNGHFSAVGRILDGWAEIRRIEQVPTQPVFPDGMEGASVNTPIIPEIMTKVCVTLPGSGAPKIK